MFCPIAEAGGRGVVSPSTVVAGGVALPPPCGVAALVVVALRGCPRAATEKGVSQCRDTRGVCWRLCEGRFRHLSRAPPGVGRIPIECAP